MDDLASRTFRELLTLARERLGRAAVGLKTREELIAALRSAPAPSPVSPAPTPCADDGRAAAESKELVTRDFFVWRA
jgi:hypothetical protein